MLLFTSRVKFSVLQLHFVANLLGLFPATFLLQFLFARDFSFYFVFILLNEVPYN